MINNHAVYIISAVDEKYGIGKNNALPWRIKKELAYFSKITKKTNDPKKKNMLIMGKNTWFSLPAAYRPLPDRINAVLTRSTEKDGDFQGAVLYRTLEEALEDADEGVESIFIAGGASLYHFSITHKAVDGIYLTQIEKSYECDTFFPAIPTDLYSAPQDLGMDVEKDVTCRYSFFPRKS